MGKPGSPRGWPRGVEAQGKKVDPTALRHRRSRRSRSSARSGHQEARCVRALKQHPQGKTWRMPVLLRKMSASSGAEIEAIAQKRAESLAQTPPHDDLCAAAYGQEGKRDGIGEALFRRGLCYQFKARFQRTPERQRDHNQTTRAKLIRDAWRRPIPAEACSGMPLWAVVEGAPRKQSCAPKRRRR